MKLRYLAISSKRKGQSTQVRGAVPGRCLLSVQNKASGSNNHRQCVNNNIILSQPCSMGRNSLVAFCTQIRGANPWGTRNQRYELQESLYICHFHLHSTVFGIVSRSYIEICSISPFIFYFRNIATQRPKKIQRDKTSPKWAKIIKFYSQSPTFVPNPSLIRIFSSRCP